MQETLYERNGRWLTSEQVQEFNRVNKLPNQTIIVNNLVTGEDIEVTEEEINNVEVIESTPMTEVLKEEKKYAKETGGKIKKGGKKEGTK